MPAYEYLTCDVFSTRPFSGNPLAVFPDARGIDDGTMQRIAAEMNLSETVFVLPAADARALRRLRIFTPGMELPLAGHPVVGTWYVLSKLGVVSPPSGGSGTTSILHELNVGTLPVAIDFEAGEAVRVVMTQPRPLVSAPLAVAAEAALALGLSLADIDTSRLPIVSVSAGSPCLAVPVSSRAALARCMPNREAIDALVERTGTLCVYAVHLESSSNVYARMFGGTALGVTEDPATGGAAGPLAGALYDRGLLDRGDPRFTVEQGVDMGRASLIDVAVSASGDAIESVQIAGPSVIVARGTVSW